MPRQQGHRQNMPPNSDTRDPKKRKKAQQQGPTNFTSPKGTRRPEHPPSLSQPNKKWHRKTQKEWAPKTKPTPKSLQAITTQTPCNGRAQQRQTSPPTTDSNRNMGGQKTIQLDRAPTETQQASIRTANAYAWNHPKGRSGTAVGPTQHARITNEDPEEEQDPQTRP